LPRRIVLVGAMVGAIILISFTQMATYSHLTGVRRPIDDDAFFLIAFVAEQLVAIIIIVNRALSARARSD
jgi:hypothetical protein